MTAAREITFLSHLPKDGAPEFVIRVTRGVSIILDADGVKELQGAACDFLLTHAPLTLRDGTALDRTETARFEMPPAFLAQNISASTGH